MAAWCSRVEEEGGAGDDRHRGVGNTGKGAPAISAHFVASRKRCCLVAGFYTHTAVHSRCERRESCRDPFRG